MTVVTIILGIIILGIIIFYFGGKELDSQLTAVGGLRKMYAPLVNALLSQPNTMLLKNTPSRLVIVGEHDKLSYMWEIYTLEGTKTTIRVSIKSGNQIVEKKEMDFQMSIKYHSNEAIKDINEEIITFIKDYISHQEIFPPQWLK